MRAPSHIDTRWLNGISAVAVLAAVVAFQTEPLLAGPGQACGLKDLECKVRALADKDAAKHLQPEQPTSDEVKAWTPQSVEVAPIAADTSAGTPSASGDAATTQLSSAAQPTEPPAPAPAPPKPQSPVTFRRAPQSAEKMAVPSGHVDGNCREVAPVDDVGFTVSVDGQPVDGGNNRTAADSQRCVDLALREADVQIRYDGLNTEPRLNVVAGPDAVRKGDTVTFKTHANYALLIARGEVRIFAKGTSTQQAPIAVIPVERGQATWTVPLDVVQQIQTYSSLKDGKSKVLAAPAPAVFAGATPSQGPRDAVTYVLRAYDEAGRFDETAPKVLELANIRGGQIRHNDLMAVYNGNALETRNIPVTGGAVLVSGRNITPGQTVSVMGIPAPVDEKGNFAIRQIVAPGAHQVDVAIANEKGVVSIFERGISIPAHDFFYVAMADLTIGKNGISGPAALLNPEKSDEYQDKIYVNGRLAFYLKGKVRGDTLLTAAADTREQPVHHLFSNFDSKDPRYLLRNLDPNRYYPVYGDDSTLQEDAPTRGKFYVRLERGDSNVLWGNFKTTITGTEYVRYERGLYGARAEVKTETSTRFGERRGQVEVFAAEPGTLGARDVFRGTGGSLYYLSRQNITQGSERLTVEVRDRATGLVVKTRPLAPTQDYEVNALQGRVVLRSPLASTGDADFVVQSGGLSGTEQYLVVAYEYAPGLTPRRDKVVGGRTSYWVNDHIQVGVTGYDQNTPGEAIRIVGSDVTVRYMPGTYIKLEGARSNGMGSGENYSLDGGFTFDTRTTSGARAYAKRAEIAADLAEVFAGIQGRFAAYWKDKERDYSGPGELAINRANREMGARGEVKINERWSSKTKLDGKQDEFRNYTAGEQNFTYSFNDYWKGTIGARVDDNKVKVLTASPTLNQNGGRMDVALRADYDPQSNWTTYGYVQGTVARSGEREANNRIGVGGTARINERMTALAEVSQGNGGFGSKVGADYKIDEKRASYLNYALNPDRTDIISRGGTGILTSGVRERFTDSASVFGEERLRHGGGYSGLTHAFGLDFVPFERAKAGLGFETGKLTDPLQGDVQRNAMSASFGYAHAGLAYSGKFEVRHDHTTTITSDTKRDTYLTNNSLTYKINPDWRAIGKINGSYSSSTQADFYRGNYLEGIAGLAYRPVNNDRLNALFKYTYFYDVPSAGQIAAPGGAGDFSQQNHVLSVDGAYDLNTYVTLGAKYGYRLGAIKDNKLGGPWFDAAAQLIVGRIDYHIVREWDVTGEMRLRIDPTAGDRNAGALVGVYRHLNDNFKIGAGWNFTNFTDDLTNLSYRNRGAFVNAVGKF